LGKPETSAISSKEKGGKAPLRTWKAKRRKRVRRDIAGGEREKLKHGGGKYNTRIPEGGVERKMQRD